MFPHRTALIALTFTLARTALAAPAPYPSGCSSLCAGVEDTFSACTTDASSLACTALCDRSSTGVWNQTLQCVQCHAGSVTEMDLETACSILPEINQLTSHSSSSSHSSSEGSSSSSSSSHSSTSGEGTSGGSTSSDSRSGGSTSSGSTDGGISGGSTSGDSTKLSNTDSSSSDSSGTSSGTCAGTGTGIGLSTSSGTTTTGNSTTVGKKSGTHKYGMSTASIVGAVVLVALI